MATMSLLSGDRLLWESVRDSPLFRSQLSLQETNVDELESKLEKTARAVQQLQEQYKAVQCGQTQLLAALWELSAHFSSPNVNMESDESNEFNNVSSPSDVTSRLNRLLSTLQEHFHHQQSGLDNSLRRFHAHLSAFLKGNLKQLRETRGYFGKISNDLDLALMKNAAINNKGRNNSSNSNNNEANEEASNILTATRTCFQYTALDYVYQLLMVQSNKRHVVLDACLSFVQLNKEVCNKGLNIFDQVEPFVLSLQCELQALKVQCAKLDKKLEKRHSHLQSNDKDNSNNKNSKGVIELEGYLFKRGQNAFRTWNRRWFYLKNNQLRYSKRSGDEVTVMEKDLRICLVRPLMDAERRFCFEIISPTKSHILQADSDELAKMWISGLQQGISSALNATMAAEDRKESYGNFEWDDSDSEEANNNGNAVVNDHDEGNEEEKKKKDGERTTRKRTAQHILLIPGNEYCCDCGAPGPEWASINLGVTLCIECSGVHRSLGVHISKVRSITLDTWEPEILKVMCELGNDIVRSIYEFEVDEEKCVRAQAGSNKEEREKWIRAKYVTKDFVRKALVVCNELNKDEDENDTRRWTVRPLRRRMRTSKTRRSKKKTPFTTSTSTEAMATSLDTPRINAEMLLFGRTLTKHQLSSSPKIELDSDQESTDGEDEPHSTEVEQMLTPDSLLFRAARVHNLPIMSQALAMGGDKDWRSEVSGSSVIHQSILSGSVMACELLLLNSAKIDACDSDGNSPLHLAALMGNTSQICLLLKHRANHHLINRQGFKALDLAVQNSDADIVTLLRLAALNEEIRENDYTGGDDDTFNDVVHEFSQMVYTHPERLHHKRQE